VIKVALVLFHAACCAHWHDGYYGAAKTKTKMGFWCWLERLYMCGLALLPLLELAAPLVPHLSRYPFLTLMCYSIYCAFGLVYAWLRIYVRCLSV
jgi:hypothetical protein